MPSPPNFESGFLAIAHTEFGIEKFPISEAHYNFYQQDDGVWEFVIILETERGIMRSTCLSEALSHALPKFEITVPQKNSNLELVEGMKFAMKEGYDYQRDENITNFYYFAHESIEDFKIEVIGVGDNWIEIQLTGYTIVNGSNGIEPDAAISVQTTLIHHPQVQRGIQ